MKRNIKLSVCIITLFCVVLMISPAVTAGISSFSIKKKNAQTKEPTQAQYWALLFAVGEYDYDPDQNNRPSMLEACDNLYNALLESPQYWQQSNIHVQKAGQCYLQNLIKELLWLRKSAKSEDYVFVYLTTHGYYLTKQGLPWDLFPKEEPDGKDEFLFMYNGFSTNYGIIWDDLLNFFLSIIRCQGLCLVVDSCYSGGFNDRPLSITNQRRYTAMSSQENELSYGSDFSDLFISGLQDGLADTNVWILGTSGNNDGIVSAQESFRFAQHWVEILSDQTPTESDLFGAEFPLTYA
jgi:hypothetical protein